MPNTSISLCPETAKLAQRMKKEGKNFSRFVRECLFIYYAEQQEECTDDHPWLIKHPDGDKALCRPSRRYPCRKCWPAGIPHNDDWRKARKHILVCEHNRRGQDYRPERGLLEDNLIEGLWHKVDGTTRFEDELEVIAWLQKRAEEANRFIMPLADLELEGNASGPRKRKRGIIKRALNYLW